MLRNVIKALLFSSGFFLFFFYLFHSSCEDVALGLNLTDGIAWEKRYDIGPLLLSFMKRRLFRLMSVLISINPSLFPIKPGEQQEHQSLFTW